MQVEGTPAQPPVRSLGRGEQIIAVAYPPVLCGANTSHTLYSYERLALSWQPKAKETDLINTPFKYNLLK